MFILFIINSLFLINQIYSILVLPFEITWINNTNNNYSINSLINDIFYRDVYTLLYVGSPPQEVLTLIRPDNQTIFFSSNDCERKKLKYIDNNSMLNKKKVFNYKESSSFKKISTIQNDDNNDFNYLVSESISFYDINYLNNKLNNNNKIKIDDLRLKFEKNYNDKQCGRLGIGYSKKTQLHIINQLKSNKEIDNYLMYINFISNKDGTITFGGYPHDYLNNTIYDKNSLISINTGSIGNIFLPWSLSFIKTYFTTDKNEEILVQKYSLCYLVFNFGFIKGTQKYKEFILKYYFQDLIDKKVCKMEISEKTIYDRKASVINSNGIFTMFTCESKQFKKNYIHKFPTYKLKHDKFNYIFELTYKDLFEEINGIYYFLIIFPGDVQEQWIFGVPFLKKYEFVYNYDSYTLGFYQNYINNKEKTENNQKDDNKKENEENEEGNDNINNSNNINKYIIIFFGIIICIVILILIGYLIGKKRFEQRKKKANELDDDDYEYFSQIKENKNNALIQQN